MRSERSGLQLFMENNHRNLYSIRQTNLTNFAQPNGVVFIDFERGGWGDHPLSIRKTTFEFCLIFILCTTIVCQLFTERDILLDIY